MKKIFSKLVAITAMLVMAFTSPAQAVIEKKVKVSSNDSTASYLNNKLVAGVGITITENNDGANETLTITNGLGSADGAAEFLYIEGSSANSFEQILGSVNPTADHTFLFPDSDLAASDVVVGISANTASYVNLGNTQILIGDGAGVPTAAALSGDVTMTNAGVVTIAADAVAASEISTDGVSADELNAAGVEAELEAVMDLQDMQGAVTDGQVPNTITVDNASAVESTDLGTLTDGRVCIYDLANTEIDCNASTSGVGDMLKATYDADDDGIVTNSAAVEGTDLGTLTDTKVCTYDSAGTEIDCNTTVGSGTTNKVEEDNVQVGDADIATIDFLGADFDLTENPDTEINVVIAAALTRDTEWDTIAEIETVLGSLNILLETEIDASAELRALMDDESGSGALIFAGGALGAATADTPAADDDDTSIGTTAYVQGEINGSGGTSITCASGVCNADDETRIQPICVRFENPVAADDLKSYFTNRTGKTITITDLWCESDQTVTVMVQVDDGSPADMDTVDLVCISTPDTDTSLDGDNTIADGDRLDLDTASTSGTPTWVSICATGTYAD